MSQNGASKLSSTCLLTALLVFMACVLLTFYASVGSGWDLGDLKAKLFTGDFQHSSVKDEPSLSDPYLIHLAEARRKHNSNGSMALADLQYGVIPEVNCPLLVRIGDVGDGGKWVCNPWKLIDNCVIYSLGINGDVSFEIGISNVTKRRCRIYGFDVKADDAVYYIDVPRGEFRPWFITSVTNQDQNQYRMADVMKRLGHTKIDILKIDIEYNEFAVIPEIFGNERLQTNACQLLLEVHPRSSGDWIHLLKTIAKGGFLMFSREANAFCKPPCYEYSFMHQTCLIEFGVETKKFQRNFDIV